MIENTAHLKTLLVTYVHDSVIPQKVWSLDRNASTEHKSGRKAEEKSLGLHHHPPVASFEQFQLAHAEQCVGEWKKNAAMREKTAKISAGLCLHSFLFSAAWKHNNQAMH